MFGRKKQMPSPEPRPTTETDRTLTPYTETPTKTQIKRATRTRKIWTLITSFLLLITLVFLVLVEIGNIAIKPVLTSIYFIRLSLADIVPTTVPNAFLINSIAETLGLHDFYQIGLWNFCEGYNSEGVVACSQPRTRYWFNPVAILLNELLAGATIALPADVTKILTLIRIVSHVMFGMFLTGACLSAILIFLAPLSVYSRWTALPIGLFTFVAALSTTGASVIATVMFIIMRNAFTSVADLNIGATLGTKMFVFMWIASGTSIIAAVIQMALCCCCASRRDVKTGKKRGSRKAWEGEAASASEKRNRRGIFTNGRSAA
ncbi:hypothetical protein LTR28_002561 [Elasticomyces elasticus]|nr:hypothetical protein LTR28_002561 [Elasticomyces elasticus]